jgi:hypothetical protein
VETGFVPLAGATEVCPNRNDVMPSLSQITIAPHLTFDTLTAGTADAPLVLLLHGFAESMHTWRAQVAALAAADIARWRRASAAIRLARVPTLATPPTITSTA